MRPNGTQGRDPVQTAVKQPFGIEEEKKGEDALSAAEKNALSVYFAAVERRLHALIPRFFELTVRIAGKRLRFHFQTEEQAEHARRTFTGLSVACDAQPPDAAFFCWTDDMVPYLPAEQQGNGGWFIQDETGYLHIFPPYGLAGSDYTRNRYYFCAREASSHTDPFDFHETFVSLFRWAWQSHMILMHGAAVGVDGKGVLLGARGGAGKSTLAVACLMQGMDFVADDFLLLTRQGPLRAMPLVRTVGLRPDMAALLQTGLPVLNPEGAGRDKLLLDASGQRICPSLEIRRIVFPRISDNDAVCIQAVSPGRPIVQMVQSILVQFDVRKETAILKGILDRLKDLPAYEMLLSRDPMRNARFLEAFLRQDLHVPNE